MRAEAAKRHGDTLDVLAADVGLRVRQARKERGMTLAQVGGEDLSRSFLSSVESGRSRISLRSLALVAQRLNLPLSYFLDAGAEVAELTTEWLLDVAEAELAQRNPEATLRFLEDLPAGRVYPSRAAWIRGRALFELGKKTDAIAVLKEALPGVQAEADEHFAAEFEYALGAALYAAQNLDEALVHLRHALGQAMQVEEDPSLLGKITVTIGHVLYVRGESEPALAQYRRALELFGKVRDYYTQGCIYSGMSHAYKQKGQLETALRYSKLSVAAFRASNNLREAAGEINNMAMRYQALGQLGEAKSVAQEAVERAREVHALDIEALAHTSLAEIYLAEDDLDAAEAEVQVACSLDQAASEISQIASWKALAEIADRRGDADRADELYRRVLDALQDRPGHRLYGATVLAYSEMLRRQGETDRALDLAFQLARAQLHQRGQ